MNYENLFCNDGELPLDNIVSDGGFTGIFRRIAVVGDSLSSGEFEAMHENGGKSYHDFFEYSWGQYIARMCGSTVYNFSRGGMTAKEYCESFADSMGYWDARYASQCYIIALGVNDILNQGIDVGNTHDIDFEDYENNRDSFAGNYAKIIQRYKKSQPRARFFLMTMPDENNPEYDEKIKHHRELLYKLAEVFDNTFVIDLYRYAPKYDEKFSDLYFAGGHMNPMGYMLTAKIVASYIDYIIRHNMKKFADVGFIGTDLKI